MSQTGPVLSNQDMEDLGQIRSALMQKDAKDPRIEKISGLMGPSVEAQGQSTTAKPEGFLSGAWKELKNYVPHTWSDLGQQIVAGPGTPLGAVNEIRSLAQAPANYEARRAEGRSVPYSALATGAETGGIVNPQGMEQAARQGDPWGVLGHAAVPAAATIGLAYGAPALSGFKGALETGGGELGRMAPGSIFDQPNPAQLGASVPDTKAVQASLLEHRQAAPPSAKESLNYEENYHRARPYMEAENSEAGIKTVRDAKDAAQSAVGKIEDKVKAYVESLPDTRVEGSKILDSATRALNDERWRTPEEREEGLEALRKLGVSDDLTLKQADALRRRLGQENESYLGTNTAGREAARATNPSFAAKEAAADSLRDMIYDKLEEGGIKDVGNLRKDEGALLSMRDIYERNVGRAERPAPPIARSGLARIGSRRAAQGMGAAVGSIGGPLGTAGGIAAGDIGGNVLEDWLNAKKTPNALLEKSFSRKTVGAPSYPEPLFTPAPSMTGTQQSFPKGGSLFNLEQTAPRKLEAIPSISGEQQGFQFPQSDLFGIRQTSAPPPIREIPSIGNQLRLPEKSGAPMIMPPTSAETIAREAGGHFMGWQENGPGLPRVALFRDPQTGTTLGVRENELSPANVARKISESRKLYEGFKR